MDIKEIEINGLRGIAEGELKNFNKLNILVGKIILGNQRYSKQYI